jgi:hypothetical protein
MLIRLQLTDFNFRTKAGKSQKIAKYIKEIAAISRIIAAAGKTR